MSKAWPPNGWHKIDPSFEGNDPELWKALQPPAAPPTAEEARVWLYSLHQQYRRLLTAGLGWFERDADKGLENAMEICRFIRGNDPALPIFRERVFYDRSDEIGMAAEILADLVDWMDKSITVIDRRCRQENEAKLRQRKRLIVDLANHTITLDSKSHPSPNARANTFLDLLIRARGAFLTQADYTELGDFTAGDRPSRLIKELPSEVQECVESRTGSGTRLRPEFVSPLE